MMNLDILNGDCLEMMATLADESVDCVVTSPPYWGLRDYGGDGRVWGAPECVERGEGDTSHEWEGYTRPSENTRKNDNSLQLKSAYWNPQQQAFCKHCDAWFGQLGLEPTPEQYTKNMVEIFREVRRILKPKGTLWLNLGDSYCAGSRKDSRPQTINGDDSKDFPLNSRNQASGVLKNKDLVGIPWRVAFALQADGWWLRQDIIWNKPNPMPESVKDRCTKNHEYIFLLTKEAQYFYDYEAIKEPLKDASRTNFDTGKRNNTNQDRNDNDIASRQNGTVFTSKNKRSVWEVGVKPFSEAHFAVFPIELIEPCILAGTSAHGNCADCGSPYQRVTEKPDLGVTEAMTNAGAKRLKVHTKARI
jgi:DNA modification methylase